MELKLANVRLAFPVLFEPKAVGDSKDLAYSASFIIEKDDAQVKKINAAIDSVAKEKWNEKAAGILKLLRNSDKVLLHDGDMKEQYEGFPGNYFITSRNKTRPVVLDRDKSPLTVDDGKPYAGCYVNVIVDVWAQDHKSYGKRINASLKGVQFVKDGDAFGGSAPASPDAFDDLSEGADAEGLA